MRYERKFVSDSLSRFQIESVVKLHPALFSPIYKMRVINNIYLDTHNFTFYSDNVIGKSSRKKVRIRWYGNLFGYVEKPILEIKLKTGAVGDKLSFKLKPFYVEKGFNANVLCEVFQNSDIPDEIKLELNYLESKLINSYTRNYFQTNNKRFRLTVDSELTYIHVVKTDNLFNERVIDNKNTVVELKYSVADDEYADSVANHFPFRLSKSSKYVNGIDCFQKYLQV